jgi:TolB-like protein/tetratricopeptide (TPR) repeat protein
VRQNHRTSSDNDEVSDMIRDIALDVLSWIGDDPDAVRSFKRSLSWRRKSLTRPHRRPLSPASSGAPGLLAYARSIVLSTATLCRQGGERLADAPIGTGDQNAWTKLRRRKVVQWGLAYVAASWALLQGIGFLADAFHWPDATKQVGTLILLIGLPIALVLAWYHGDRGQQRIGGVELAILSLLMVLGGSAIWYYQSTREEASQAAAQRPSVPPAAKDRSIAVLPFVNMSPDKDQEYFADGISEELLNLLAQVPELRVIARTSSFSFKGKNVDVAEIARKLNVSHVLEGSVRKSGNMVRITAQLVRASDSTHLWSDRYDRPLDDIFAVQDEIAGAVVAQLKIELLGAVPSAKPVDPRAYPLILQAKALADQDSAESRARAIELYQQVLAIAPEEARAWSGLGRVYINQENSGQRLGAEGRRRAKDALERAMVLEPDDGPTHARLGGAISRFDNDMAGAAPHFQQALALDRNNAVVNSNVASYLGALGRLDQAIALANYGASGDPANPVAYLNLGEVYYVAGRWDEAIAAFRTALTLSPGVGAAHFTIGQALLFKGDATAALAEMQAEPEQASRLAGVALAQHALRRASESDAALDALIAQRPQDRATDISMVFAWRGESDRAFEWLKRAVANSEAVSRNINDPMFAPLHNDSRWLLFLRKIGSAPEQLAAIKFDVKVPR